MFMDGNISIPSFSFDSGSIFQRLINDFRIYNHEIIFVIYRRRRHRQLAISLH